jgi:hypothetical protein
MADLVIWGDHPYFALAGPWIWQQSWNQKWTVRWRDFYTVKQDLEFDTKAEAEAFAKRLFKSPKIISDENGDVVECDEFWRTLATKAASAPGA